MPWCYRLLNEISTEFEYDVRSGRQRYARIALHLVPSSSRKNQVQFDPEIQVHYTFRAPRIPPGVRVQDIPVRIPALIEMAVNAIEAGSQLVFGFRLPLPVSGVIVQVEAITIDPVGSTWIAFRQAAILALEDALTEAEQDGILIAVPDGE